jgi:hypothetical protein
MTKHDRMPDVIDAITRTMGDSGRSAANVRHQTTEAVRKPSDVIQPDGFPRAWLDRNFGGINGKFVAEFGYAHSPLEVARERLQALGAVTLLDVGCGTGNSLRVWAEAVRRHADNPADVTPIGVNLHDYSDESAHARTREAIQRGDIQYVVDNAEVMSTVPEQSADVVLAFMSLVHMRRPFQAMRRIERVMRPGGAAFVQLSPDMMYSDTPIASLTYKWEEDGYVIENTPFDTSEIMLMRIQKPEAA